MKTVSIYYQTHFEISFISTFDTFKILYIFHVILVRKLEFVQICLYCYSCI